MTGKRTKRSCLWAFYRCPTASANIVIQCRFLARERGISESKTEDPGMRISAVVCELAPRIGVLAPLLGQGNRVGGDRASAAAIAPPWIPLLAAGRQPTCAPLSQRRRLWLRVHLGRGCNRPRCTDVGTVTRATKPAAPRKPWN